MSLFGPKRDDLVRKAEELFAEAAVLTGPDVAGITPPSGRTYINEADLQGKFKQRLEQLAATARPAAAVSPSLGHKLKDEWPKLGLFDISLAWPEVTVYGELKCGASEFTLSACGWDAAKCAFALNQGTGDGMLLVAAAPAALWKYGVTGTELLLGRRDWKMTDIRERYSEGFTAWEKQGYKPLWVPASFDTRPVAAPVHFLASGEPWQLHVAAVENPSEERLDWVPFL